ncbi:6-carboxytetrahydropterin synthase [Kushneria phosphatilytica]|uniref:6-carboxy-5,6,7,8-tetrahydropterin synthase n=1 Tax=Kushneria phosphatilytica TaxID=657387 RepID=A0A1S1P050_9GAMM|nr:6-carboxytetrahydropterin synthase [Kushneria phosphatilytica]OHV11855.1 6-pyruvoyl tetrahydropterin synthase-related protein [Kushneria phosphatilytica]QEL11028.1 6-pyruvoyl tetrahydropterin synthase-related protein [Kushneria phosphatilytica]
MTLFVNDLTNLDVSLLCPQRGLVGASWQVNLELEGELGEDGMLFDFGEVKPWAKSRLDGEVDHTLLVPAQADWISVTECAEGLCVRTSSPWEMEIRAPRQAFTLLPWTTVTPEQLEQRLSQDLMKRPPARVSDIRVTLDEEWIEGAAYTYSHGLRRHAGNCQRIAHGHRSRLFVWRNGHLDEPLAEAWANRLQHIYLADQHDQVATADNERCAFAYESPQGRFRIQLPARRVMMLPSPTTVELIARWLAEVIAREAGGHVRVQAFEGIGKGAMAEARH